MLNTTLALGNLLFETPWPIVVGLVVVWALMRLVGVRLTGEREATGKRLRSASWSLLVVAAGLLALAWYVQTPAERMTMSMRQLLAAVEQEDWETFDQLVAEDATARYGGLEIPRMLVDSRLHKVKVEDITLLSQDVVYYPKLDEGVTGIHIRVRGGSNDATFDGIIGVDISVWAIHWRRRADGQWEATRFEHLGSGIDEVLGE
ncbi:hypothetical protein OT109_09265 [Phycisphaeraceae bacterium D3-23]